jgi:hypothetical protein
MAAENALATSIGMQPGEILIDYPAKTEMLGLDLPVLRRDGRVDQLTSAGSSGSINLPRLSDDLYRSARWLRVFSSRPVKLSRDATISLLRS